MSIADDFFRKYDKQTEPGFPLRNPLASLRSLDDQGVPTDPASRPQMIADLEDLSRRLWHMATITTPEMVFPLVLRESDGGVYDLTLLDAYADLVGLNDAPAPDQPDEASDTELLNALDDLL